MRLRPLPSILTGIVLSSLRVCDRTEYFVQGTCRSCGGRLSGYDTRVKRFAVICTNEGNERINVILHRAYCRTCGRIWTPEAPFYPGTRAGSPVVDLCRALSETIPSGQVATRLSQMGVFVDRWTVRSYWKASFTPPPTIPVFGMNIPISIISLSSLAQSQDHEGHTNGEDILAACFYPSRERPVP